VTDAKIFPGLYQEVSGSSAAVQDRVIKISGNSFMDGQIFMQKARLAFLQQLEVRKERWLATLISSPINLQVYG